jgi:hypothetical protein
MDPIANKIEQNILAKRILAIWDDCNADGTLTKGQSEQICNLANRLAELVEALAGWEKWNELKQSPVR